MGDRIKCCVPFCRRTADANKFKGEEIICGKHWRLASQTTRRRHSRFARLYRRRFGSNGYWNYPPGSALRMDAVRIARICNTLWERGRSQATESAVGIR